MAIPCDACGRPVHEQVVVCPHCGERTGVPADPTAELQIAALSELVTPPASEDLPLLREHAIEPTPEPDASLPRAIVRPRRRK